ncbi:MAG: YdeI/OmpD-associated family protein [Bacteroidota bacterium]
MNQKRMEFKAKLEAGGEGNAWVIMNIPFNVEEVFGNRGRVAVKGTINGFPYRSSIFPWGDRTHHVMVNRAMREGANVKVGDTVNVIMEVDTEPRIVEVPPDFKKALAKNKKAQGTFEKLPPSHKRAYVEAILEAKRPETRERRIKGAIEMLAKGEK